MQCFDFKGGIGTASRVVPDAAGDLTVGVLVCTNFGARPDLTIAGVPVGLALTDLMPEGHAAGSCIVVVATDAPMLPHQLRRLALRSGLGLARCGSIGANGSGELMLAFSTAQTVPRAAPGSRIRAEALLDGAFWHEPSAFDPIFTATIEATEEAVVNALFAAETTTGRDGNVLHALPAIGSSRCWIAPEGPTEGCSCSRRALVASGHTSGARSAAGVSAEYHPKVGVAHADRPMRGWPTTAGGGAPAPG
jgi:D-aminopeptidase